MLSIAAGVTIATLEALAPGRPVVRAMPNTPALVGLGASAIAAGRHAGDDAPRSRRAAARRGRHRRDASASPRSTRSPVSRVRARRTCSSSPRRMIEAGVLDGLPRDVAEQLVVQTLLGSATLLAQSDEGPEALRAAVTSPGGTTAAGLRELESARRARRDPRRGERRDAPLARARRSERVRRRPEPNRPPQLGAASSAPQCVAPPPDAASRAAARSRRHRRSRPAARARTSPAGARRRRARRSCAARRARARDRRADAARRRVGVGRARSSARRVADPRIDPALTIARRARRGDRAISRGRRHAARASRSRPAGPRRCSRCTSRSLGSPGSRAPTWPTTTTPSPMRVDGRADRARCAGSTASRSSPTASRCCATRGLEAAAGVALHGSPARARDRRRALRRRRARRRDRGRSRSPASTTARSRSRAARTRRCLVVPMWTDRPPGAYRPLLERARLAP